MQSVIDDYIQNMKLSSKENKTYTHGSDINAFRDDVKSPVDIIHDALRTSNRNKQPSDSTVFEEASRDYQVTRNAIGGNKTKARKRARNMDNYNNSFVEMSNVVIIDSSSSEQANEDIEWLGMSETQEEDIDMVEYLYSDVKEAIKQDGNQTELLKNMIDNTTNGCLLALMDRDNKMIFHSDKDTILKSLKEYRKHAIDNYDNRDIADTKMFISEYMHIELCDKEIRRDKNTTELWAPFVEAGRSMVKPRIPKHRTPPKKKKQTRLKNLIN